MIEILQFLKKYEVATGATINISKTTILPSAGGKIYNLDKKNNIQTKDIIKIVGVLFTDDLKTTNTSNWNNCIQGIEKQTQQLSRRHLSLRGKAILLNTQIFSKVTFLSNVFLIPNPIQQKLETHIFKHIWRFSNKKPIVRARLFLSKNQGGIRFIQTKYHSLAIRIKQFLKLKEEGNQKMWITQTRYNLASVLYSIHKNFRYVIPNKIIKTDHPKIEFYYEDIITYIKQQNSIKI